MIAQVTQYLRPNGRQKDLELEIPDEYQQQYDLIHSCGCRITCEQMMSGKAVQYISHKHGDYNIETTPAYDKKAADKALLQMVKSFDKNEFDKWVAHFEEKK